MRSTLFLFSLFGALALAEECQCPQVKCASDDAAKLCQCINNRESKCAEKCPDYVPKFLPCPINPPSIPIPTATTSPPTCTCHHAACPMVWPLSCHCANDEAIACYEKCGGVPPVLEVCSKPAPTLITKTLVNPAPTLVTKTLANPVPSLITKTLVNPAPTLVTKTLVNPVPTLVTKTLVNPAPSLVTLTYSNPAPPKPTHAVCGGGRGNYKECEKGFLCMKDPFDPGCGPQCDGFGICVEDKICGGFAGWACKEKGQTCVDDPRDDCDPKEGGSDCGGLCVWKTE